MVTTHDPALPPEPILLVFFVYVGYLFSIKKVQTSRTVQLFHIQNVWQPIDADVSGTLTWTTLLRRAASRPMMALRRRKRTATGKASWFWTRLLWFISDYIKVENENRNHKNRDDKTKRNYISGISRPATGTRVETRRSGCREGAVVAAAIVQPQVNSLIFCKKVENSEETWHLTVIMTSSNSNSSSSDRSASGEKVFFFMK